METHSVRRSIAIFFFTTALSSAAFCQQAAAPDPVAPSQTESKRILWIIPNFRTSPTLANYEPITPSQKFKIATLDAFDRGTIGLALAFAGEAQLSAANPSFGNGIKGYGHYFITAYGDFVIGDYLTEGVFPALLHQDPRYFRRGTGSGWSRVGYAAGQIFWTHNDSGRGQFNLSEVAGNASAVAISMAYYPENRDAGNAVSKLGTQLGVDMASNILKEFWPDLARKLSHKHPATPQVTR